MPDEKQPPDLLDRLKERRDDSTEIISEEDLHVQSTIN
jgi:hypothetical protein